MTLFRPCIDLHEGAVKQIVGGSLRDESNSARENFVSATPPEFYAELYRKDGLKGGHVILLGPGNEEAAKAALRAWPGGLQVGGGINPANALSWIEAGAAKVIVTSWLFENGELSWDRLKELSAQVGRDRLVVDLSCRRADGKWFVATDRWQTVTKTEIDAALLKNVAEFCSELLVHAADVEGLRNGIDEELVAFLGEHSPIPATYAGGATSLDDLARVDRLSKGRVDLTIGSALDLFGGDVPYEKCAAWNAERDFGRPFRKRQVDSHHPVALVVAWVTELVTHIPAMLALRFARRRMPRSDSPRVVLFFDNIDEVNGISISVRLLVNKMREQGRDAWLLGIAGRGKPEGRVDPDGTTLLPQVFSMEMVGYKESELPVPSLREAVRWFRRHPVDLLEIETPSSGSAMMLLLAKIAGIRVISHYRTDIFAYLDALTTDRPGIGVFTRLWVKAFCKLGRPVIVPSTFFIGKLQREMGLKPGDVTLLPRGIDLANRSPVPSVDVWGEFFDRAAPVRFATVSRVSKEKELPFLEEVWREFSKRHDDVQLAVVGKGPYLDEMRERLADCPSAVCTGLLQGGRLTSAYAQADWFLFPSGTDTFGNVVVESLACGTPAIVSDMGGPRDIVEDGKCGKIVPFKKLDAWVEALEEAYAVVKDGRIKAFSEAAVARSRQYTLDNSANAFWDFYVHVLKGA
ncbi:MAG: phosphoribosylformimino-5-aminoimidazole carboxamide ribotide isomerase [Fibrobacterales bacterium]|nr:phosphoribosylformimino-5-aminoimidazole carboxamide ribotide isomerase [Fibrobacterales bacterium]